MNRNRAWVALLLRRVPVLAALLLVATVSSTCATKKRDFATALAGNDGQGGDDGPAATGGAGLGAGGGAGNGGAAGLGGGGSSNLGGMNGDGGAADCASGLQACEPGRCTDVSSDGEHCGECGRPCTGGSVCQDGSCRSTCDSPLTACNTSCVDLMSNPAHCRECERACPAPQSNGEARCVAGECDIACAAGREPCLGQCVDFESDEANCGGCAVPCSGECVNGVCCPADRESCPSGCVDLTSSAENCGACDRPCAQGQVCQASVCRTNCAGLDRCGNDCVNTAVDLANCGMCGVRCTAPARNGQARCTQGQCSIACNTGSLRCGDTCCDAPPADAVATCQAGVCGVQCNPNYHACAGTSSPCYPNTDVAHCGASCTDCRQPNAAASCVSGTCRNTCAGLTLTCPGSNGKPACGSWDFESQTAEGWSLLNVDYNAADGGLTTRAARATSGARALALGWNGDGNADATNPGTFQAEIKVRPCPSGQALNMDGLTLLFDIFAETTPGTPAHGSSDGVHYLRFWNGATSFASTCDFNLRSDQSQAVECTLRGATTDISLLLRVFAPWRGTFYIDNMRIQ